MNKYPEKRNGLYYLHKDGKEFVLPSVTSITGEAMPKPQLIAWATRMAAREALHNPSLSEEQVIALVTGKKTDGGDRGALIHDYSEASDNGHEPGIDTVPEDMKPYVIALNKFRDQMKPKLVVNEKKICNLSYGYAGRMDRIYDMGGKRVLADYKTSANYYPEMGLQLAAYKYAEFMFDDPDGPFTPMLAVDSTIIVLLGSDGTYTIKETNEPLELFINLKKIWEWINAEKATKTTRRTR